MTEDLINKPLKHEDPKCPRCRINPPGEPELCQYDWAINDTDNTCTCCEECRLDCSDEI